MKLLCTCLMLAAVTAPGALQAQGASTAPKPAPNTVEETHKMAVMVVNFAKEDHQIIFELFPSDAPKTVDNFISNVDKGTYKGLAFHRAIEDYLVQTGDPATRDNSNRDAWGLSQEYTIPGEFKRPHISGAVAMARRGDKVNPSRQSDGTQFYFVLGNMSALNGQYTVFGQVTSGMDALRKISRSVKDTNDTPLERIEIKSIKVIDHKGPPIRLTNTGDDKKGRRQTKPTALKGPFEKILERVW